MFKKVLLLLGFLGLLHAQAAEITLSKASIEEGSGSIYVNATYGGNKTWVGVYKVGTSTDWKNVQTWSWIKNDNAGGLPVNGIKTSELSAGEYEVRLFFHNSYKMEAKTSLTVTPSTQKPFIKLDKKIGNSSIDVSHSVGPKAWIGIYPKGSSTDWNNVKSWKWAEKDGTTNIPVDFLERGTYEARLFYHNSYVVEDKFTFGPVGGGPGGGFSPIKKDKTIYLSRDWIRGNAASLRLEFDTYGSTTEKPWVGIYKKGAPINKQNLVAKGELKKDNEKSWITLTNLEWNEDSYDMVYHPTSNFMHVGERKTLSFITPKLGMEYNFMRNPNPDAKRTLSLNTPEYNKVKKDLDWIGIFKADDEPIRQNLLAKAYSKKEGGFNHLPNYPQYTYKVVLFSNDTYKILSIATIADDI